MLKIALNRVVKDARRFKDKTSVRLLKKLKGRSSRGGGVGGVRNNNSLLENAQSSMSFTYQQDDHQEGDMEGQWLGPNSITSQHKTVLKD